MSGGTLLVFDVTLNPIQVLDHTEDYMEVSMEITTIVARIGVEKKTKNVFQCYKGQAQPRLVVQFIVDIISGQYLMAST